MENFNVVIMAGFFDGQGKLVGIPQKRSTRRRRLEIAAQKSYEVIEQDGFIFVRLEKHETFDVPPQRMPHYG